MSIASILAFVLAGTAARAEKRSDEKLARELVEAKARIGELEGRVAELTADVERANVQARRDQDAIDYWRAHALAPMHQAAQLPPDAYQSPYSQHQAAAALAQQAQAQMAQFALANAPQFYAQGLGQTAQGLLGTQHQINPNGLMDWCNCVPARHDMLLPRRD